MSNPIRVLVLISSMDVGGAETFIMKVFRNIDNNKIMFDFLVSEHNKCFYDDEILKLGGKIFKGEFKSKHPIKSFLKIYLTVRNQKYKVVFRCSEHPMAYLDLLAAKLGGAKMLMIRSTNTSTGGGILSNILAYIFRPLLNLISNIKIAPSTEAGKWLFGKQKMDSGEVLLMNNGIEVEKFVFSQEIRDSIRKDLCLEDKFVIGHVGRFNAQKNHLFLLDVFSIIVQECPNAILMLIGKGEREKEIREKAELLNLSDKVIFMGVRSDVNNLMMAMDVFVFPSLYEGMPNVVIEAQATGLPCIISDTITREVALTNLVNYFSLNDELLDWAEFIIMQKGIKRNDMKQILLEKGYDISVTADIITNEVMKIKKW